VEDEEEEVERLKLGDLVIWKSEDLDVVISNHEITKSPNHQI
jgi:hypothetical protein